MVPSDAVRARAHPLLEALDDTQWEAVERTSRTHRGPAREALFRRGDPAHRFFWLGSGLVQLTRESASGQEQVLEVVRPGQLFAEALMFVEAPVHYPVTASFVRASRLISFHNATIRELIRQSPELGLRMLSLMAQRMHRLVATIDELTLHTATERVAQFVLDASSGQVVFTLDLPKKVLAAQLALTPESLSRVLADLRRRGLVHVYKEQVQILDRDGLSALAEGK